MLLWCQVSTLCVAAGGPHTATASPAPWPWCSNWEGGVVALRSLDIAPALLPPAVRAALGGTREVLLCTARPLFLAVSPISTRLLWHGSCRRFGLADAATHTAEDGEEDDCFFENAQLCPSQARKELLFCCLFSTWLSLLASCLPAALLPAPLPGSCAWGCRPALQPPVMLPARLALRLPASLCIASCEYSGSWPALWPHQSPWPALPAARRPPSGWSTLLGQTGCSCLSCGRSLLALGLWARCCWPPWLPSQRRWRPRAAACHPPCCSAVAARWAQCRERG